MRTYRWLFVQFFIRTYLKRIRAASPPPDRTQIAKDAGKDAAEKVERELHEAMAEGQGPDEPDNRSDLKARLSDTTANLKKGAEDLGSKAKKSVQVINDVVRDKVQAAKEQATSRNSEYNESEEQDGEREKRNGEPKEEVEPNGIDEDDQVDRSKEELEVETSEPEEIESNIFDGDEKAYEVNPDEVLDSEEKKAAEEMQPNGGA